MLLCDVNPLDCKMVFKTQNPHPVAKKPDIGEECAIITSKSHFINRYNNIFDFEKNYSDYPLLNIKNDNEEIEVHLVPLTKLKSMLQQNEIKQSMHALCLFYAFEFLQKMEMEGPSALLG